MTRAVRRAALLAKVETTSGTDAAPTNTADAVLLYVDNIKAGITQQFAERDVITGAFGAPDQLPVTARGTISFSVDLAGSGAAGTAPQWGDLLIGCGFSETVTAGNRVEYLPASASLKTLTLYAYIDGVLRKFIYCAGNVQLSLNPGKAPTLDFTFTGLVVAPAAAAVPTPTLSAWTRPVAVSPTATTTLKIGSTYSAGAISGGTDLNFSALGINLGNDVQDLLLATSETVGIYNRTPSLEYTADVSAAVEVAEWAAMAAGTTTAIGITHGTAAGNKIVLHAPVALRRSFEDAANGSVLLSKQTFDLRPSAGNDELRIVAL